MEETYISKNIKFLRLKYKVSQTELGNICNKGNTAVANWEKGIREPVAIDLAKIANYFHVSIDDLIKKDLLFEEKDEKKEFTPADFNYQTKEALLKTSTLTESQKEYIRNTLDLFCRKEEE